MRGVFVTKPTRRATNYAKERALAAISRRKYLKISVANQNLNWLIYMRGETLMTSPLQHRRFQFSLRAVIVATVLAGVAVGAVIRWLPYYRAGKAFDSANDGESFPRRAAMREALVHTKSFRDAIASYSGTPQITTHPTMDTANNFGESVWIMELKRGWFVEFKELNGVPTATRVKSYRHEDRAEDAAEWNAK